MRNKYARACPPYDFNTNGASLVYWPVAIAAAAAHIVKGFTKNMVSRHVRERREALVHFHFELGFSQKEILYFLLSKH